MLSSLFEHEKGHNLDVEGCGLNCLCILARFAASLRWYYPDQVHRVGTPPVAVTSQPNGSPSS